MPAETIQSIASRLAIDLTDLQERQLEQFEAFLATDAVVAGGIGPTEVPRLRDRHIIDSLMFLKGMHDGVQDVVDVGSGVGLPGIPLAIACPDRRFTLVDRSQKRTDLAGRAVRILGLTNVSILTADAARLDIPWDVMTFRGSLPVQKAAGLLNGRLDAGRTALFGVSRLAEEPELPESPRGVRFELTEESKGMLDSPFWLLRMTSA